ncbi:uncharacterized protein LAESUDRAFT_765414 [Laetiporus sulphureus 93-53]|uniref:Uncharacterized protein n=1 Tax=Laetiporus sulphureus 93-53 TaxID=1314785 RepID=A0A165AS18_9APHY|nr:uncharacterized protein LAESUDRAFT_765415 [Laetiporus sulphureus 93-53]XP_040757290.1 uncharacterized protein LAESUDRAFT_765414 [Laetiporus sulphureus 93-53]KZS99546.1 hypothetical protein LAESUDRAFT_765415 [Laetiporus sulphureus 93-53]KZS99549.1 hypothetical protein LAESUDRAFT_765414 [Laetiporus sulphureus 93-53]
MNMICAPLGPDARGFWLDRWVEDGWNPASPRVCLGRGFALVQVNLIQCASSMEECIGGMSAGGRPAACCRWGYMFELNDERQMRFEVILG